MVEDHPDMAAYIRRRLEPTYDVLEASTGDVALRLVAEEVPDLVVSDVLMPGMDGFELCRALKAAPESRLIPVILLTARAALDDKVQGLDCGADDYITKPFESKELLARVHNLLEARVRIQRHFETLANRRVLKPSEPQGLSNDESLLRRMWEALEHHACKADFGVDSLSRHLAMSRVHLHRRLVQICGMTPSEVIIEFRLESVSEKCMIGRNVHASRRS